MPKLHIICKGHSSAYIKGGETQYTIKDTKILTNLIHNPNVYYSRIVEESGTPQISVGRLVQLGQVKLHFYVPPLHTLSLGNNDGLSTMLVSKIHSHPDYNNPEIIQPSPFNNDGSFNLNNAEATIIKKETNEKIIQLYPFHEVMTNIDFPDMSMYDSTQNSGIYFALQDDDNTATSLDYIHMKSFDMIDKQVSQRDNGLEIVTLFSIKKFIDACLNDNNTVLTTFNNQSQTVNKISQELRKQNTEIHIHWLGCRGYPQRSGHETQFRYRCEFK